MLGFLYFWELLLSWKLTFSEHWMNFLSNSVSLVTYLSYIFFLLDGSIFTSDEEKEEKNQFLNCFWRILIKFEEKNLEIHKLSSLSINWILKKLKSIKTLVKDIPEFKLSHGYLLSKTYRIYKTNLCIIQIITLFLFGF